MTEKKSKEKGNKEGKISLWYPIGGIIALILMLIGLWIPGAILSAFIGYKIYKINKKG